jgi:hypothetical protein
MSRLRPADAATSTLRSEDTDVDQGRRAMRPTARRTSASVDVTNHIPVQRKRSSTNETIEGSH